MGMKSLCKMMNKMRDCGDDIHSRILNELSWPQANPNTESARSLPLLVSSVKALRGRGWLSEHGDSPAQSVNVLSPWAFGPSQAGKASDSILFTKSPRGHVHPGLQPMSNPMPFPRTLPLLSINCTLGHLSHRYT